MSTDRIEEVLQEWETLTEEYRLFRIEGSHRTEKVTWSEVVKGQIDLLEDVIHDIREAMEPEWILPETRIIPSGFKTPEERGVGGDTRIVVLDPQTDVGSFMMPAHLWTFYETRITKWCIPGEPWIERTPEREITEWTPEICHQFLGMRMKAVLANGNERILDGTPANTLLPAVSFALYLNQLEVRRIRIMYKLEA